MKAIIAAIALVVVTINVQADGYYDNSYGSPQIYSQNGRYLGNLNSNPYDPNSVSNPYGRYGSPYSQQSPNNPYGQGVQIYAPR